MTRRLSGLPGKLYIYIYIYIRMHTHFKVHYLILLMLVVLRLSLRVTQLLLLLLSTEVALFVLLYACRSGNTYLFVEWRLFRHFCHVVFVVIEDVNSVCFTLLRVDDSGFLTSNWRVYVEMIKIVLLIVFLQI